MPFAAATPEELHDIFSFHPVQPGQAEKYQENRDEFEKLSLIITKNCPPSRELSLAITHLQTALMFANAAIAIRTPKEPPNEIRS